jgi:hypothetical protein
MEFNACKEELESDALTPDLVTAFMKISKLLEVLSVFDVSKDEKESFEKMGLLTSKIRFSEGFGS